MTWAQLAEGFTAAAGKAMQAGDEVASLVLAIKALECAQIARNLGEAG